MHRLSSRIREVDRSNFETVQDQRRSTGERSHYPNLPESGPRKKKRGADQGQRPKSQSEGTAGRHE